MMISFLFFLVSHGKSSICFYEKESMYDASEGEYCELLYFPKNYSLFEEYLPEFRLTIIKICGKIEYTFSLDKFDDSLAFDFQGSDTHYNSIHFKSTKANGHQFDVVYVDLIIDNDEDEFNFDINSFSLIQSRIKTNSKVNIRAANIYIDTYSLMSINSITVDNAFNLIPMDYVVEKEHICRVYMMNSSIVDLTSFETAMTIGFYYNALLLYSDPTKALTIQFPNNQLDIKIRHYHDVEISIINILSYGFMHHINSISISLTANAILHFLPCNWPETDFFSVESSGSSTVIFDCATIPGSFISRKGSMVFILNRNYTQFIGSLEIEQTLTLSLGSDTKISQFEVPSFVMSEGAAVHSSLGITFYPSALEINTTSGVYLTGSGYFTMDLIDSSKIFSLEISNLIIKDPLDIQFIVGSTHNSILVDFLEYQGADVNFIPVENFNPTVFIVQTAVFKLSVKSQTKTLNYFLNWGASKSVYRNGTNFFTAQTQTQDTTYVVNGITLDKDIYSTWCLGNESKCPSISQYIPPEKYSQWPFGYADMIKSLKFYITDDSYSTANALNFQKFLGKPSVNVQVMGTEGNRFAFDSTSFHIFKQIISNNASLELTESYITKSNVKYYILMRTKVHPVLEMYIKKAPNILLDEYTAKNMIGTSRFTGTITLQCHDKAITLSKECISIESKPVYCTKVNLTFPSQIIGDYDPNTDDDFGNLSITVKTSNTLDITGRFPDNWTIEIISANNITTDIEDPHFVFRPIRSNDLTFTSSKHYAVIQELNIDGKLTIDMPENSILDIKNITVGSKASIIKTNPNITINIPLLRGSGHIFNPTAIGYNSIVRTTNVGTIVRFDKDENINMTLELRYSLSQMPIVEMNNGTYESVKKVVFIHQSHVYADDEALIRSIPYPFVSGYPVICGEQLNCTNWSFQFRSRNPLFANQILAKCKVISSRQCVFLYASEDLLPKTPYHYDATKLYLITYGSAAVILLLGIISFLITYKIKSKKDSLSYNVLQSLLED